MNPSVGSSGSQGGAGGGAQGSDDAPEPTADDNSEDLAAGASSPAATPAAPEGHETELTSSGRASQQAIPAARRFRLTVIEGPKPGVSWESASDSCSIGSHASNDLVIEDPTVSRFHCELRVDPDGARIRDLRSLNGTILDGIVVIEAFVRGGSVLRLGRTALKFEFTTQSNRLVVSEQTSFGGLVGTSVAMRSCFAFMERAALTEATVLLEGETGTGKGRAAEAIHRHSTRKDCPFIVVDCGAIPANLLESELFGHERGAFTGAANRRIGAFEEASSGTIFLDEIGELPAELQPKLLRVLENREIRRIGSNVYQPVDVRVIAATNRDLRAEVNASRFRPDLYFRLAVVKIPIPPLRERPEDLPVVVEQLLGSLTKNAQLAAPLKTPEFIDSLRHSAWPGNVRELRNHLERCLVFQDALPLADAPSPARRSAVDASLSYAEARRRALDDFERDYLEALLRLHQGKVAKAAGAAEIGRVSLYRLMRRHNLKP